MKRFILSFQLLASNVNSYIILVIQIAICMTILLPIICAMQYHTESRDVAYSFNSCNMYTIFVHGNVDFEKRVEELPYDVDVGEAYGVSGSIASLSGKIPHSMMAYNDVMIENAKVKLTDGVWFDQANVQEDRLPAVVIRSEGIQCGDVFEASDGITAHTIEVIGTVERPAYFYDLHSFSRSLESIISTPDETTIFLIPLKRELAMPPLPIKMLFAPENITKETVLHDLKESGNINSVDTLKENYIKEINEDRAMQGTMFIVFSLLTLAGLIGINGIQNIKNKPIFAIYYMTGLSWKQCVLIESIRSTIVMGVSFLLYLLIGRLSSNFMSSDNMLSYIGPKSHLIVFIFGLVLFMCSALPYIISTAKESPIAQIKKWGE